MRRTRRRAGLRGGEADSRHRSGRHRRSRWNVRAFVATAGVAIALAATTSVVAGGQGRSLSSETTRPSSNAARTAHEAATTPDEPMSRRSRPKSDPRRAPDPPRGMAATNAASVRIRATGSGEFVVAAPAMPADHPAAAGELTYTVELEEGLPFDPEAAARTIDRILDDPRGWQTTAGQSFHQVPDRGALRILIATPDTTDVLCAPLETNGEVSCRNGDLVVLNARRWAFATDDYRDAVSMYRTYLVNHEVGHALGYGHTDCPGPGEPAPVMQQQTHGLDGCRRNPWPSTA